MRTVRTIDAIERLTYPTARIWKLRLQERESYNTVCNLFQTVLRTRCLNWTSFTICIEAQSVFVIRLHNSISSPYPYIPTLHMVSCHGCHAICSRPTCDLSRMVRLHIRSWIFWHSPIRTICWKVNLPRPLSITIASRLLVASINRHFIDMNHDTVGHDCVSIVSDVDRVMLLC